MVDDNVIHVPPRRRRIVYKGMHGWVEYHPSTKTWSYKMRFETRFTHEGEARTEAEAVLELKVAIDVLSNSSRNRSID
jgi:hypothetical protein